MKPCGDDMAWMHTIAMPSGVVASCSIAARRSVFVVCPQNFRTVLLLGNGAIQSRSRGRKTLTEWVIRQKLSAEDSLQEWNSVKNLISLNPDPAEELAQAMMHPDSLAVRVRAYLLTEVTSGRLRPGERINEAELARRLGISRNPIREAISGLVQKGFLVAKPRRGAELRTFTRQDVEDIFSFRTCVEQFALGQAMDVMTTNERAEFPALVDKMLQAAARNDVAEVQSLDMLFHRNICLFSRNRITLRAFETIDTEVRMLIASVDLDMEPLEQSATSHRPMAEAIHAGDAPRALDALGQHIAHTHRFVCRALKVSNDFQSPAATVKARLE